MIWDLILRAGGQMRVASGRRPVVLGYDMAALLAMGRAMGLSETAVMELAPPIEAVMARESNRRATQSGEGEQ